MLASSGSTIRFWSTDNFELIQDIHTSSCNVSSLSWNKDGHFLAALDEKTSEIGLYTVSSSTAICSGILRIMDNINSLQFCNTSNRYLAVGGLRDSVVIWDVKGNSKKKSFMVSRAGVTKLCFNSSDSHLAVGTVIGDGFLLSNTNNLVSGPVKFFSEKTKVTDIRYSVISHSLIGVCAENGSVVFMDTNTTKILKEFSQAHSTPASALAFSPINELLMITVGYDKKFVTYNAKSKSVVMTHRTTAPLTSVCFLSNGQYVALGSMTGDVFIYDLRVLKSPMVTLTAQDGPIKDLRIQPEGKVATENLAKAVSGSKNITQRTDVSSNLEKMKSSHKTGKMAVTVQTDESYSPFGELVSPTKVHINREERTSHKNVPLLKNLIRTPKPHKKSSFAIDDLGILSPIDKENKSPAPSHNAEISRRSSIKHDLIVDGLLSPLDGSSSLNKSSPNKQNSRNSDDEMCDKSAYRKKDSSEIIDEILSPLQIDCDFSSKVHTSSSSPQTIVNKENTCLTTENEKTDSPSKIHISGERKFSRRERSHNSGVDKVKRNLIKEKEGSLETESLSTSNLELVSEDHKKVLKKNLEKDSFCSPLKPNMTTPVKDIQGSPKSNQGLQQASINIDPKDEGKSRFIESKTSTEPSKDFVSNESINRGASRAFEIAFPATEKEDQENQTREIVGAPVSSQRQRNSRNSITTPCDVNHLNLELIRNCVSEELERRQFYINQRFMNLQYTMVKHFFNLRKEMRILIKESSLNEELLAENQKLREELERWKCTF